MTTKFNGNTKWIGLGILIITNVAAIAYNVGVTNTKIFNLTTTVTELKSSIDKMNTSINSINIKLAAK